MCNLLEISFKFNKNTISNLKYISFELCGIVLNNLGQINNLFLHNIID